MSGKRRVAAHVVVSANETNTMSVVDIDGGIVVACRPLEDEEPFTEWLGGVVELRRGVDGALRAYKDGKQIV